MNYISYEQAKELIKLIKPTDTSAIESDIADIQSGLADAQSGLADVQGSISSAQGGLSTAQGDIKALQMSLDNANGNISSLQDRQTTLEDTVTNVQSDVASVQAAVEAIPNYQSDITAINNTLTTLQAYHRSQTVALFAEVEYEIPDATYTVDLYKTHSSGLGGTPLITTFPEGSFAVIIKDGEIVYPSADIIEVDDPEGKIEGKIHVLDLFQGVAKGQSYQYNFDEPGTYTVKFYTKGGNTNGIVQGDYDDTTCPTYPQLFRNINVPFTVKSINLPVGTTNILSLVNDNKKIKEFGNLICPSVMRCSDLFNGTTNITKIGDIKLGSNTILTDGNSNGRLFFGGCTHVTEIGDVYVENLKNCSQFFYGCTSLTKVGRVDVLRTCVSFGDPYDSFTDKGFFGGDTLTALTSIRIASLPESQWEMRQTNNKWDEPEIVTVTTTTGEGDDATTTTTNVPLVVDFTKVPNLDEASFKYMSLTVNAGKSTLKFTEEQKTNYASYISNLQAKGYTIA